LKTPIFKTNVLLYLLLALVLLSSQSMTDEIKFNIGKDAYPPYIIIKDEKISSGIIFDIVNKIAKNHGHTVAFFQVDRKKVDASLKEIETDATARIHAWQPEDSNYIYTDIIIQMKNVFFFVSENDLKFDRLEDLYGKKFKTHIGYLYSELEELMSKGLIRRYDEYTEVEMLNKLLISDGKFDATILDERVGLWLINNDEVEKKFNISKKNLGEYEYKIMFHNKWEQFVINFNEELLKMKENGELDKIINKYLNTVN